MLYTSKIPKGNKFVAESHTLVIYDRRTPHRDGGLYIINKHKAKTIVQGDTNTIRHLEAMGDHTLIDLVRTYLCVTD